MKRFAILILLILLAVPTSVALADDYMDRVVESDETVEDDLVIFSGDLLIEEGAIVTGDVVVFSGNADVAGTVEGDVVLFSGNLEVTETADIQGDCVLFSGNATESLENVNCTHVDSEFPAFMHDLPNIAAPPAFFSSQEYRREVGHNFFGNVVGAFGSSILLGILAFVVASFAPNQLQRTQEALRTKTITSGTVGVLTAVAVPALIAVLAFLSGLLILACGLGLLGFPVVIALAVGLALGALFGWITVGSLLGQKLMRLFKMKPAHLPIITALGTAVLTFIFNMLDAIPFVPAEGLLAGVVLCLGLGATTLTHFGTKTYPRLSGSGNNDKMQIVFDTLPDDPANLK